MSQPKARKAEPVRVRSSVWWLALGLLAVPLRLGLWWYSIGSNDVNGWLAHGQHVWENGLVHTYQAYSNFNHPPIPAFYSALAWKWAGSSWLEFGRVLKLPALLGDGIIMWALWKFAGPPVFAAYAWLPAAALVSSYHGNTDSLCAAFVLLAAIAFDRGRHFTAALLFGAALNIKILPIVLLPLLVAVVRTRSAGSRVTAGLAIAALPFAPPVRASPPALRSPLCRSFRPCCVSRRRCTGTCWPITPTPTTGALWPS